MFLILVFPNNVQHQNEVALIEHDNTKAVFILIISLNI